MTDRGSSNPFDGADPVQIINAIVSGLQEAAPEATEHLVKAGEEFIKAAKIFVESMTQAVASDAKAGPVERIQIRKPTDA